MSGEWCLIESDPGVFSSLIRDFGVKGIQVEEIFTLDKSSFEHLKPIHGLVFLFKCMKDENPEGTVVQDSRLDHIFFAKQVITNACATQAIVNILLNVKHADVVLGSTMSDFKDFTQAFDSINKGLALSNSDVIRAVHNSFSRQQIFEFDNSMTQKDQDSYHFIGYMPIDGRLYELDGIKEGPVDHGAVGNDWLDQALDAIKRRIARYKEGEIHFNLLALTSDRKMVLERQINHLQETLARGESMETDDNSKVDVVESEMAHLQSLVSEENDKRHRYQIENIRRKHNYLPFIVELLKVLAKEGKLHDLVKCEMEKSKKARSRHQKRSRREIPETD